MLHHCIMEKYFCLNVTPNNFMSGIRGLIVTYPCFLSIRSYLLFPSLLSVPCPGENEFSAIFLLYDILLNKTQNSPFDDHLKVLDELFSRILVLEKL